MRTTQNDGPTYVSYMYLAEQWGKYARKAVQIAEFCSGFKYITLKHLENVLEAFTDVY